MLDRLRVGLAAEDRVDDIRVALRPKEVAELLLTGLVKELLVEKGAGERLGYTNRDYEAFGGRIVSSEFLWSQSDLIIKYKAPSSRQMAQMTEGIRLAAIMHPENDDELVDVLLSKNIHAFSLEYYESDGLRPVSSITGKISGILAFQYGVHYLQLPWGSGKLVGGEDEPITTLIIGHGNVGGAAAHAAARAGCDLSIAGRSQSRAQDFLTGAGIQGRALASNRPDFVDRVASSDIVIGSILISTFDTAPILTTEIVSRMRPGSVIVDATAGYGSGYIETMPDPMVSEFAKVGHVTHVKIDNFPARVARTTVNLVAPAFREAVIAIIGGLANSACITSQRTVMNEEVARHRRHRGLHLHA